MIHKYLEKNTPAVIKDLDVRKGIVEGYFSTWGIVDADGDEMMPGCYLKSLAERGPEAERKRIMHLAQHNPVHPLHRFTEIDTLKEDEVGLWFKSTISQTSFGKDILLLYQDEVVDEHSVGIQIVNSTRSQQGHNQVFEAYLWEGSTVTWGSNMATPVTAIKGMTDQEKGEYLCKRVDVLTKAFQKGTYTDETFVILELHLKQIQAHYLELIKEPGGDPTLRPGGDPTDQNLVTVDLKI